MLSLLLLCWRQGKLRCACCSVRLGLNVANDLQLSGTLFVLSTEKTPFPEGYCGHVQQELDQLRARFDWQVC